MMPAGAGHDIVLSPISLAEIVYLVEKGRLPASAYDELRKALNDPDFVLEEAPFTGEVVETMRQVPRADIPDMPTVLSPRQPYIWVYPSLVAMASSALPTCEPSGKGAAGRFYRGSGTRLR
jgi:hypothetical protein